MNDLFKVWTAQVDHRYNIYVERTTPYNGNLFILDGSKEICVKPVTLSYDAKFGPDIADVAQWQEIVLDFIDKEYTKNE